MRYRVAVRFIDGRQRYHIQDIEATSMTAALRGVVDSVPEDVLGTADLVEIRPQIDEAERGYSTG